MKNKYNIHSRSDGPFTFRHLTFQITQLTGFSDPVYAEAYVNVNQYDIVLDVLVVNQTADTLQNCTIELATLGDLKLVERPQPMMLGPMDFCSIKANVKESDHISTFKLQITTKVKIEN